jgi:hypothetical protein
MEDTSTIEETGTLTSEGAGFVLERDLGGRLRLVLPRMPIDHVEKRVRVTGVMSGPDSMDVEGVAAA